MTASLTPALALAYITRAVAPTIRAGVVLDARGDAARRAPRRSPRPRARARREPAAAELEGATSRRRRSSPRATQRHAIVVVTGPFALPRVTRHDLRTALSALGGRNAPIGASADASTRPAVERPSERRSRTIFGVAEPFTRSDLRALNLSQIAGFSRYPADPVRSHC